MNEYFDNSLAAITGTGNNIFIQPGTSFGAGGYGTTPSPTHPWQGSSPPQQVPWSVDMLSSSPLTGPGATFQSLRPRQGSFDHGKQTVGADGVYGEAEGGALMLISFEDIPPSPFAESSVQSEISERNITPAAPLDFLSDPTTRSDDDDDEDDEVEGMMFSLDSSLSGKPIKAGPISIDTNIRLEENNKVGAVPISLVQILSNPPVLIGFNSSYSYVSIIDDIFISFVSFNLSHVFDNTIYYTRKILSINLHRYCRI